MQLKHSLNYGNPGSLRDAIRRLRQQRFHAVCRLREKVPETTECNAKGHLVVNKTCEQTKVSSEIRTQHYPADAFISFLCSPFPSAVTHEIAHSVSQICKDTASREAYAIARFWNNRAQRNPTNSSEKTKHLAFVKFDLLRDVELSTQQRQPSFPVLACRSASPSVLPSSQFCRGVEILAFFGGSRWATNSFLPVAEQNMSFLQDKREYVYSRAQLEQAGLHVRNSF